MGLRDMILGKFIKVSEADTYTPSELAREVELRQQKLERQLHDRERRRDVVYAQVQGLRGR